MRIHPATAADADAACTVLRRSIEELCLADHGGDREILRSWLANKTPGVVAAWIADPTRRVVVAVDDAGAVLGVGMASPGGTIELNYVSPDARFCGVSKAIMQALEAWLRSSGHARRTLVSTATARAFYTALGYREDGPAQATFGVAASRAMAREL